ncbi:WD40 repeat domain-containing protein [Paenibacillus sp. FSL K6-2862]|uniref:WD40 repeat domain-containing protein n=1 Tax=Paenibacillus sp. FSL K6-2862 TaxID=2921484 RepID=UPI0030F527DB
MITKDQRNQVQQFYAEGSFTQLTKLFDSYTAVEWLDFADQAGRVIHMEVLSLYIEASLHIGNIHRVECDLIPCLKRIFTTQTESSENESFVRQLLDITEGMVLVFQEPCDSYAVIGKIGSWLDRGQLVTELRFKALYTVALANLREGNLLDAQAKLHEWPTYGSSYWDTKLKEMETSLGECSLLYTDAVQSPSRKRAALLELTRMDSWIGDLAISPDGSMGAIMGYSGQLKLIRIQDGTELKVLTDYKSLFSEEKAMEVRLVFSPDGSSIAVGMAVGLVAVVDLQRLEFVREFKYPGLDWEELVRNAYYEEYTHVLFSTSGKYLLIIPTAKQYDPQGDNGYSIPAEYGTFYILDFVTGEVILKHTYVDRKIIASVISPDERFLAIGMEGKEMEIWDLVKNQPVTSRNDFVWLARADRVGSTQTMAFTANSEWLLYAAQNSEVHAVHVESHHPDRLCHLEKPHTCCAVAIDSKDRVLIAVLDSKESLMYQWKITDGRAKAIFDTQYLNDVHQIMIDEERDRLWLIDRTVAELYHYSSGKRVQSWNPHSWSYSYGVVYNRYAIHNPNGQILIGYEDQVRIGFLEQRQEWNE